MLHIYIYIYAHISFPIMVPQIELLTVNREDVPGATTDIFYIDVPLICDPAADPYCPGTYDSVANCGSAEYYGWPRSECPKIRRSPKTEPKQ